MALAFVQCECAKKIETKVQARRATRVREQKNCERRHCIVGISESNTNRDGNQHFNPCRDVPDYKFNWKRLTLSGNRHIRMRDRHNVVLDDVFCLFEPEGAGQIQDRALEGDECQLPIKARLAVRRYQGNRSFVDVDAVTDLATFRFQADLFASDLQAPVVHDRHGLLVLEGPRLKLRVVNQLGLSAFSRHL